MLEVRQTQAFQDWFDGLRDRARFRIVARIRRRSLGTVGDARPVGRGVSELRIAYGPGDRVYFHRIGSNVIVLLAGGDKSSQRRDIVRARELARGL